MSKFDVGDRVSNYRGHRGTVKGFLDIRGTEYVDVEMNNGSHLIAHDADLHRAPKPPAKSPLTEEQIEFLRDLWWNEPAGTDAERILGELLKWRV